MGVTGWEHMNSMRNLKDILLFPHSTKNKILFYNISLLPEEISHPFPSFWPLSPGKGEGIKMGWLQKIEVGWQHIVIVIVNAVAPSSNCMNTPYLRMNISFVCNGEILKKPTEVLTIPHPKSFH